MSETQTVQVPAYGRDWNFEIPYAPYTVETDDEARLVIVVMENGDIYQAME
jgi:hypothetical protein